MLEKKGGTMRGKPKFKVGDVVRFGFEGYEKVGVIYIVDTYGTFEDSTDVSYDILVETENILYKHFPERKVVSLISNEKYYGDDDSRPE